MSQFTMTALFFAATQSAIAKGKTLTQHAASAAAHGICSDAAAFAEAYTEYKAANAYTVSLGKLSGYVDLSKATKAKGILPIVKAVAKHNAAFPKAAPTVLTYILSTDGETARLSLVQGNKPRKVRATTGTAVKGKGSRKSSYEIACGFATVDGFTIDRTENNKYILDGVKVDGHLSKALYRAYPDSKTATALREWKYVEPK